MFVSPTCGVCVVLGLAEGVAGMRLFNRKPVEPAARVVRDEWLEWMRLSGLRDETIKGYRLATNKLLARYPELALSEFNDEHIIGLIEECNLASRINRRSAFQNLFGWAYRSKRIPFNPMQHVPVYKQQPQKPVDVFTDAECKILRALPEPDGTLMAVLLDSGLRKAEARHLTVRRVDLENAEIHIVEGAKGGHAGVTPIEQKLVHRLAEYFLVEGLNDQDHLWYCRPGGHPRRVHDRAIVDASMHQWWKRCVEKAGIPYRNMHVTRHTYATEWRRRGLSFDDVGFMLRHRDFRTTQRVYVHTKSADIRRRMEEVEAAK